MKASVIIPTCNRVSLLRKNLVALSRQDYPKDEFEVIVIDNGSTDGTHEFLESFKHNINLRTIRYEANQGAAKAHNEGIEISKGEIVILLDDDLVPVNYFLKAHLTAHREKHCAVIGKRIYLQSQGTKWLSHYLSTRGIHKIKDKNNIPFKCFWTGNSSFRKEDIVEIGLFDEEFKGPLGGEDLELGYRWVKKGWKLKYIKEAITYHPPCNLKDILRKQRYFGEKIVPLLLKKDPCFYKVLKLNLIENSIFFRKIALSESLYTFIEKITNFMEKFYVPPVLFDYLIYYNRVQGIKNERRDSLRQDI